MPPLPSERQGKPLLIRRRPLPFSYWPMYKYRRDGLQSTLFALDPWVIIQRSIAERCLKSVQPEALAYLRQARDFYGAATLADVTAARPLLLYYCFLNLAKAYVLTIRQRRTLARAKHGLYERLRPRGKELTGAYVNAVVSPNGTNSRREVFDEFLRALRGSGLQQDTDFQLVNLLPQALPGHRLWAEATGKRERFISLYEARFREDAVGRRVWLSLCLFADDLARVGIGHAALLTESRLDGVFREVRWSEEADGRRVICFEQTAPVTYNHRSADEIADLVASKRQNLWAIVSSVPPYRKHYLYPAPMAEHGEVLPQLASVYAMMFYLGSITRYRPHHLSSILEGQYGAFVQDFVVSQPLQFIYLMASEFAQREVTRPAIV